MRRCGSCCLSGRTGDRRTAPRHRCHGFRGGGGLSGCQGGCRATRLWLPNLAERHVHLDAERSVQPLDVVPSAGPRGLHFAHEPVTGGVPVSVAGSTFTNYLHHGAERPRAVRLRRHGGGRVSGCQPFLLATSLASAAPRRRGRMRPARGALTHVEQHSTCEVPVTSRMTSQSTSTHPAAVSFVKE